MSARPSRIGREPSTFTLAPHTVARLAKLSELTGVSRGRLIDLVVEGLDVCDDCRGTGRASDEATKCGTCQGNRLLGTL